MTAPVRLIAHVATVCGALIFAASPVLAGSALKRVEAPQVAMLSAPLQNTAPKRDYQRLPRPSLSQEMPIMAQAEKSCETDGYVGKRYVAQDSADAADENTITRADLPEFSRVLRPGDMATMDYHPNRLNLMLDENDVVTEAKCG